MAILTCGFYGKLGGRYTSPLGILWLTAIALFNPEVPAKAKARFAKRKVHQNPPTEGLILQWILFWKGNGW